MKKIIIYWFFVLVLTAQVHVSAQENNLSNKLILSHDPIEKITLHTDRNIYLTGEKIWFKAYCHDSNGKAEGTLSKVLYVELFSYDQRAIVKQKYRIENGIAKGCIEIPKEFISGNYRLRAYTQFLKNYPSKSFFTTILSVINPQSPLPAISKETNSESIEFYPENSSLISGIESKLVFRVPNSLINSIQEISLMDDQDRIITKTGLTIANLGILEFKPEISQTYFLKIRLQNNDSVLQILPDIKNTDIAINQIPSNKNNFNFETLDKTEIVEIEFENKNSNFSQRNLVNISIHPQNTISDQPINYSISVVKKGTYEDFPSVIFEDLQMLKSFDKHLDYHTLSKDKKAILKILYNHFVSSNLDLKNDTNRNNIYYNWLPEIRDVSISGVVYEKNSKHPIQNIPIYLSVFKNNPQIHIGNTHENGEFIFSLNDLENNQEIFLCPISEKGNEVEIKINTDFSNDFPNTPNINLTINKTHETLLNEMFINQQTNEFFNLKTISKKESLNQYPLNIKKPEVSVLLDDFINLSSMETVFREIVPKCMVRKRNDEYSLFVVDALTSFNSNNPLILLDNIPVFSVNELMKIHPSKIKQIDVSPTSLILGDHLINGLITITTNTDNFGGIVMPKASTFLEYQTIEPSYEFVSPSYQTEEKLLDRTADFRNLLYWNPDINSTGNAHISFYTSDHCSEYEVIVRGITREGKKVYGRKSFFVTKE